ncbi:MAG: type VI secretion system tube protein Hcp [Gemmatimonadaceae bacterium]
MKHERAVVVVAACLLAAMVPSSAAQAQPVMLRLKANGVEIKGSVMQKGRENAIKCDIIEMSVKTPRDASSGMAAGRRQYEGISCTKPIDRATPLLAKALAENEVIDASFQFWEPQLRAAAGTGAEVQFYTIDIKQGRVVEIRQFMDSIDPAEMKKGALERVTFVFQSITFTINDEKITFSDAIKGSDN